MRLDSIQKVHMSKFVTAVTSVPLMIQRMCGYPLDTAAAFARTGAINGTYLKRSVKNASQVTHTAREQ